MMICVSSPPFAYIDLKRQEQPMELLESLQLRARIIDLSEPLSLLIS